MSRIPSNTDFQVTIDGIGTFTFGRRRMRDELAIAAEFSRLTEGVETPTPYLTSVAGWISTLKVLTVEAPEGWLRDIEGKPTNDLDQVDPLDDETYANLIKVHGELRKKEGSFRSGAKQTGEAQRSGDLADT